MTTYNLPTVKSHSEAPLVIHFVQRREWVNVKREVSYIAYSVQYNIINKLSMHDLMSFRDCVQEWRNKIEFSYETVDATDEKGNELNLVHDKN